jgi:prophage regulatory protein
MRIMRCHEVLRLTGLSRATISRLEGTGGFPARRKLSSRTIGWPEEEVQKWLSNRGAARGARTESRIEQ